MSLPTAPQRVTFTDSRSRSLQQRRAGQTQPTAQRTVVVDEDPMRAVTALRRRAREGSSDSALPARKRRRVERSGGARGRSSFGMDSDGDEDDDDDDDEDDDDDQDTVALRAGDIRHARRPSSIAEEAVRAREGNLVEDARPVFDSPFAGALSNARSRDPIVQLPFLSNNFPGVRRSTLEQMQRSERIHRVLTAIWQQTEIMHYLSVVQTTSRLPLDRLITMSSRHFTQIYPFAGQMTPEQAEFVRSVRHAVQLDNAAAGDNAGGAPPPLPPPPQPPGQPQAPRRRGRGNQPQTPPASQQPPPSTARRQPRQAPTRRTSPTGPLQDLLDPVAPSSPQPASPIAQEPSVQVEAPAQRERHPHFIAFGEAGSPIRNVLVTPVLRGGTSGASFDVRGQISIDIDGDLTLSLRKRSDIVELFGTIDGHVGLLRFRVEGRYSAWRTKGQGDDVRRMSTTEYDTYTWIGSDIGVSTSARLEDAESNLSFESSSQNSASRNEFVVLLYDEYILSFHRTGAFAFCRRDPDEGRPDKDRILRCVDTQLARMQQAEALQTPQASQQGATVRFTGPTATQLEAQTPTGELLMSAPGTATMLGLGRTTPQSGGGISQQLMQQRLRTALRDTGSPFIATGVGAGGTVPLSTVSSTPLVSPPTTSTSAAGGGTVQLNPSGTAALSPTPVPATLIASPGSTQSSEEGSFERLTGARAFGFSAREKVGGAPARAAMAFLRRPNEEQLLTDETHRTRGRRVAAEIAVERLLEDPAVSDVMRTRIEKFLALQGEQELRNILDQPIYRNATKILKSSALLGYEAQALTRLRTERRAGDTTTFDDATADDFMYDQTARTLFAELVGTVSIDNSTRGGRQGFASTRSEVHDAIQTLIVKIKYCRWMYGPPPKSIRSIALEDILEESQRGGVLEGIDELEQEIDRAHEPQRWLQYVHPTPSVTDGYERARQEVRAARGASYGARDGLMGISRDLQRQWVGSTPTNASMTLSSRASLYSWGAP